MKAETKIMQLRLEALQLAQMLGNVTKGCGYIEHLLHLEAKSCSK